MRKTIYLAVIKLLQPVTALQIQFSLSMQRMSWALWASEKLADFIFLCLAQCVPKLVDLHICANHCPTIGNLNLHCGFKTVLARNLILARLRLRSTLPHWFFFYRHTVHHRPFRLWTGTIAVPCCTSIYKTLKYCKDESHWGWMRFVHSRHLTLSDDSQIPDHALLPLLWGDLHKKSNNQILQKLDRYALKYSTTAFGDGVCVRVQRNTVLGSGKFYQLLTMKYLYTG